jgi:hypothetical protein
LALRRVALKKETVGEKDNLLCNQASIAYGFHLPVGAKEKTYTQLGAIKPDVTREINQNARFGT